MSVTKKFISLFIPLSWLLTLKSYCSSLKIRWAHSCLSSQVISGTIKVTSLGTSLHSCQVTGSQESVPAHCLFPCSSVSQSVTQFCFVTFLHSGNIFWWGISFLPWIHSFSRNFFGAKTVSCISWVSWPSWHSVYGTTCK